MGRAGVLAYPLRVSPAGAWLVQRQAQIGLWLFLALLLLILTACAGAGSPPPGVGQAVFTVVTGVWALRNMAQDQLLRNGLPPGKDKSDPFKDWITEIGQHVQFFLRWRAERHLASNPDTDAAKNAVAAEYDQVRAVVAKYVGLDSSNPATLVTGTDKPTTHLDLADVLRRRTSDPPVGDGTRLTQQDQRWKRAMNIVWRAAALEDALWTPSFSEAALVELLDRRLRITERMFYQVNGKVSARLVPSAAAPHGPWQDGIRVRMFEYPILDSDLAPQIGAANIGDYGTTDPKIWRKDFDGGLLYYAEGNGRRIAPPAVAEFVPEPGATFVATYPYDLVIGGTPGGAVDHLFTPSTDWWGRSWIYCDHVLAALHIEALRFGKLRRTGDDALFNGAVNGHTQGWAELRPLLPPNPGDPRLMADDASKPSGEPRLFANGPVRQLQLGDHVVFWNSIMYGLLSDGAWSLENAIVVGVDSDWTSNDIGDDVHLMGHGTGDTRAGSFREEVSRGLDASLRAARLKAKAAAGDNTDWIHAGAPLVKWAPYGENWEDEAGPQAPWWIRIPYTNTSDWNRALGRDATLHTLPDAVEYDPAAGFTAAPPAAGGGPTNAAYFPLWVPAQTGKWQAYISRRRSGQVPPTFKLAPMRFDRKNIPGLTVPSQFVPGQTGQTVFAVRPIVAR
jgi:hypothetical protein